MVGRPVLSEGSQPGPRRVQVPGSPGIPLPFLTVRRTAPDAEAPAAPTTSGGSPVSRRQEDDRARPYTADDRTGTDDGIRTHDPNLGKVNGADSDQATSATALVKRRGRMASNYAERPGPRDGHAMECGRHRWAVAPGCADHFRHGSGDSHPVSACLNQAPMGQAISEMEGTCHQTWIAELASDRDAIGTWAVDEIGTFGPRRNQLQLGMMEAWQMWDRRAGMPGTTDPSRP